MATELTAVTSDWTEVYSGITSGSFSGGIQCVGNTPVYVSVTDGASEPSIDGGFIFDDTFIYPISVGGSQVLWARAYNGTASVVLG